MVREVVIHPHTVHLASHLHTACNTLERLQGIDRMLDRDTRVPRCRDSRQSIFHVVRANE